MSGEEVHLGVKAAYDRWSAIYDAYDNPMVAAAGAALAAAPDGVSGAVAVEFGCGTGRNLAALKAMGASRLVGLDLSPGMLEKAALRDPAFELHAADMAAPVPLGSGMADLVLFCLTLEHVSDITAPLTEAARLLKAGGRVRIIEIHPYLSLSGIAAHFVDDEGVVRMPTVAHRFSDLLNGLVAAGLSATICREWRPRDFPAPLPAKALKRGPDMPLIVDITAGRR